MSFNKFIFSLLFLLTTVTGFTQIDGVKQEDVMDEDNVFLDGVTTDYYSGKAISGIKISAVAEGKTIASGTSDGKGEYKIVLEYDKEYIITFSKAGFITKKIVMNTFGVPDIKRQKVPDMMAEITMIQPNECIKKEMLDKPIGKAKYFPKKNVIDWDMVYSMPLLAALNQMLDDCAEQQEKEEEEKKQRERDCLTAMKEANKAFSKENYDVAKKGYEKAISLCENKAEAEERIALIATEIAKKEEAEKQRAEEKARAEAEALAKAEAEAAAKKAEEERIAKEQAEKEVLAKALAEEKELAKAEAAAKKAEEERMAKEKKAAEAKAKKEVELKAKLEKEAATRKAAEEKAKAEEAKALAQAKKENEAKLAAEKEAKRRAEEEAKAILAKEAALKKEKEEKEAKELAAKLALKAEVEREANQKALIQLNAQVKIEVAKQQEEEKKQATANIDTKEEPAKFQGSESIRIKRKNPTRHLYEKPNKSRKGKGPTMKKRMVF